MGSGGQGGQVISSDLGFGFGDEVDAAAGQEVESEVATGDIYDNALSEAFNSLFKAELVRNKGPWRSIDDLEIAIAIAIAEYIEWFNHRRLHGEIGMLPPVEHEDNYYSHNPAPTKLSASIPSLH